MKKIPFSAWILAFCCGLVSSAFAQTAPEAETTCFESRKGASEVVKRDLQARLAQRQVLTQDRRSALVGRPI
jgi:hypothetical protein